MEKLVQRILQPSLAYDVVLEYKNKLEEKIKRGETSIRSARLAVKPAVALMLSMEGESAHYQIWSMSKRILLNILVKLRRSLDSLTFK